MHASRACQHRATPRRLKTPVRPTTHCHSAEAPPPVVDNPPRERRWPQSATKRSRSPATPTRASAPTDAHRATRSRALTPGWWRAHSVEPAAPEVRDRAREMPTARRDHDATNAELGEQSGGEMSVFDRGLRLRLEQHLSSRRTREEDVADHLALDMARPPFASRRHDSRAPDFLMRSNSEFNAASQSARWPSISNRAAKHNDCAELLGAWRHAHVARPTPRHSRIRASIAPSVAAGRFSASTMSSPSAVRRISRRE